MWASGVGCVGGPQKLTQGDMTVNDFVSTTWNMVLDHGEHREQASGA